jgi:hypothetical protein
MSPITLTGSNLLDGTVATFTPTGTTTPITGKITGGVFTPDAGQIIPMGTTTGTSTGVLKSVGVPDLTVPTNFSPASCTNGATNPPSCNVCTASYYYDTATSKCLFLQKTAVDYREFTPNTSGNGTTTGIWNSVYKTNNGTGYNTFKCDDIKALVDPSHMKFDSRDYFGIKEICANAITQVKASGVDNPRVFFYAYIYKQVNSSTGLVKYYSYVYTSYEDVNGNFVPWYSQAKKDNANSTGWSIYDGSGTKIG